VDVGADLLAEVGDLVDDAYLVTSAVSMLVNTIGVWMRLSGR
jgi:hypothetical protein